MNFNKNQQFTLLVLLPLTLSMLVVSLNKATPAPDQAIETDQLTNELPVIGFLELEINGQLIDSDYPDQSVGQTDVSSWNPFYTYRHDMTMGDTASTGRVSAGRIQHSPIIITKRIDGADPLIIQGMHQAQRVDAVFHFFVFDSETGMTIERYNVEISNGLVTSIRTLTILDQGATYLVQEVSFVYEMITFTDLVDNTEYTYTWQSATF